MHIQRKRAHCVVESRSHPKFQQKPDWIDPGLQGTQKVHLDRWEMSQRDLASPGADRLVMDLSGRPGPVGGGGDLDDSDLLQIRQGSAQRWHSPRGLGQTVTQHALSREFAPLLNVSESQHLFLCLGLY